MVRKLVLTFVGLGVASVVAIYLLTIPLLRRLPKPGRVSMDGITTIYDAVEACRRTQLQGWDLVAYAQHLVARKFTYSRLNTWDSPSRAFERGMGYCEQQALVLKQIYDRLGIESRGVLAFRCKFPAGVIDGIPWPGGVSGHAWLRVRIGDEELDVCPGSVNNKPGMTHFEILSKVRTWHNWLRPFTHLESSLENIRRDMLARRSIKERREMNSTIRNEALELLQQGQQAQSVLITEAHLLGLPEPVQRYLKYSQVVGKETIRTVRLKQKGNFRQSAQQPWMNLDAEEYYSVNPPGFLWVGTIRKAGLPLVRAKDRYRDGKGNMHIKLGTLFTIANATGEEMDQASMMRYLNEMMWFPTAFLGPNVSFEPVDQTSAKVTLTDLGKQVTATMYFDDEGRPTDFVAPRYYREGLETWSTPITEYGEYRGFKLPARGKAVWKLKEGDLEYIDVVITDLEYNVTSPY